MRLSRLILPVLSAALVLTNLTAKPGDAAPGSFMLTPLKGGEPKFLREYLAGGPAILSFWATYCKPCEKEMPEMQALLAKYPNAKILFVNIDGPSEKKKVKELAEKWGITQPILLDQYQVAAKAYIPKLNVPATFLISSEGKIQYESIGFSEGTIPALNKALAQLK